MSLRRALLLAVSPFVLIAVASSSSAQVVLPEITVTAPSPIQSPIQGTRSSGSDGLQGTLPIVTDQFATTTVIPNDELRRSGAATLGDLLSNKPGITGSSLSLS